MYIALSVIAALIGLTVTGFGVFAAYAMWTGRNETFRSALGRWTVFDYAILGVYLIGTLFLLADLVGVLRDREMYPLYHYGYLLSGLIYHVLAGLFLFVRIGLTIRLAGPSGQDPQVGKTSGGATAADHHHAKPKQA